MEVREERRRKRSRVGMAALVMIELSLVFESTWGRFLNE